MKGLIQKKELIRCVKLNNLVYVQLNPKLSDKKRREREYGADVLLVMAATKAQAWIVDGGDDEEDDDEAYLDSGLM